MHTLENSTATPPFSTSFYYSYNYYTWNTVAVNYFILAIPNITDWTQWDGTNDQIGF